MLEAEHHGSKAELRLGELNRPSKIIITQNVLVILARRNQLSTSGCSNRRICTIFLGNCPGRSQKFVAPHSEHAYFGTSLDPGEGRAAEFMRRLEARMTARLSSAPEPTLIPLRVLTTSNRYSVNGISVVSCADPITTICVSIGSGIRRGSGRQVRR